MLLIQKNCNRLVAQQTRVVRCIHAKRILYIFKIYAVVSNRTSLAWDDNTSPIWSTSGTTRVAWQYQPHLISLFYFHAQVERQRRRNSELSFDFPPFHRSPSDFANLIPPSPEMTSSPIDDGRTSQVCNKGFVKKSDGRNGKGRRPDRVLARGGSCWERVSPSRYGVPEVKSRQKTNLGSKTLHYS